MKSQMIAVLAIFMVLALVALPLASAQFYECFKTDPPLKTSTTDTMETLISIKDFHALRPMTGDERLTSSVRLLCVCGFNGSEVIFATREDRVYGFGANRYGCLGLGTSAQHIPVPTLNPTLSGQRLVDICCGFAFRIGVTAGGQCWSWGENKYGQLGTGDTHDSHTPLLIRTFRHLSVAAVVCGKSHTLALTADGQVFAFGRNQFGQLADRRYGYCPTPTPIADLFYRDVMASLSAGKHHSLALGRSGRAYVWGINDCGQCGPQSDDTRNGNIPVCHSPRELSGLPSDVSIVKAVCGPNHTLLLSGSGQAYAIGGNNWGQIGNGTQRHQSSPAPIAPNVRFKDLITHYDHTLSIGLSIDGQYYVWGMVGFFAPRPIPESMTSYTVYDIYANYCRVNKTFETIVFDREVEVLAKNNNGSNVSVANEQSQRGLTLSTGSHGVIEPSIADNECLKSGDSSQSVSLSAFLRQLSSAFDNECDYDL
ncbi:unnamed protein product, partial [Medioppia subpectinata]